jgi:hypothetical protein
MYWHASLARSKVCSRPKACSSQFALNGECQITAFRGRRVAWPQGCVAAGLRGRSVAWPQRYVAAAHPRFNELNQGRFLPALKERGLPRSQAQPSRLVNNSDRAPTGTASWDG